MNDCRTCGRGIRYRVVRVSINRRPGVSAWLEPRDGENCICLQDFSVHKFRSDKTKPTVCDKMIAKWNTENPT